MWRFTPLRFSLFAIILLSVNACSTPAPPPTPDAIATGVAEAQAVAVTLTASAPTATFTFTPTFTSTPTRTPTNTFTATPTNTAIPTKTFTPTSTFTQAPSATATRKLPPCTARNGDWIGEGISFTVTNCVISDFLILLRSGEQYHFLFYPSLGGKLNIQDNQFAYQRDRDLLRGQFTSPTTAKGTWTNNVEGQLFSGDWSAALKQ